MTVENSVSKTPKLVMGAKTYDFNFDVLLEDPTAEEAKRAIKCSISNGTEETELIYGTDYTVTLNSDKKGGVVTVADVKDDRWHIVIYRQYNMTQGVDLNDYNEFPAETIERAFDKQTMLIQELKEIAERSVKVTPANNQTPEELLDEVYSKLDSATEVATNAIAAATLATTAAESATKAVEDAEQQVAEVTKYIDDKKVEIDGIVVDAQNSVDGAIQQATEDVKTAATEAAEAIIQDAGETATNIAVDYVNTTVKPELQGISDSAKQYATNAKASADAAKVSETNAKVSETASKQSETNAKVSETNARNYATSINPNNLLNKNMITNCITHIPQDIKLELVDGVLTLKAGSKVYVPNYKNADGSMKFDVVNITSDKTTSQTVNGRYFLGIGNRVKNIALRRLENIVSGPADSIAGTTYHWWYDTTNNVIKTYGSDTTTPNDEVSLPLAIVTVSNNIITSIDQVFNGFGYIGSTIFALPGVKGLIPNGRNADGSLRNEEVVLDSVKTRTSTGSANLFMLNLSGEIELTEDAFHITRSLPIAGSSFERCFDTSKNQMYYHTAGSTNWVKGYYVIVGNMSKAHQGVITSLTPKNTFQAVDRNDTSWLSRLGMPSDKYEDLTLGASGSEYVAPANGWFSFISKATTANGQYCRLINTIASNYRQTSYASGNGQHIEVILPIQSGQQVAVYYTAPVEFFRFIYAQGEK